MVYHNCARSLTDLSYPRSCHLLPTSTSSYSKLSRLFRIQPWLIHVPCPTHATRVLFILRAKILMFFFPSLSIMQIMHISPSSRDAISFVYIFPRGRGKCWISLRDSSVIIGASSRRSFGLYIHHRAPRAAFHFMQRDIHRSMIERSGMSLQAKRQMVARPWDLSYTLLQSLRRQWVYATCAESRLMISVIVERRSSLCSWGFVMWIE